MTPLRSPSNPPSSSAPTTHDVAVALFRSLDDALTKEYARRYDAGVVLHHTEETRNGVSTLHLDIDYQGQPELRAEVTVVKHDESTVEVACAVENAREQRFSYRVPVEPGSKPARLPRLGPALATYLLDELETQLTQLIHDEFADPAYA